MARTFLGADSGLAGYRQVFEIDGGLEIDENNFTQIERTRVYFDDVLAITYHRMYGTGFLIFTGAFAGFFILFALIIAAVEREPGGAIAMGIFSLPFAIAFFWRMAMKLDVITVYGRRTKAVFRFSFRKERARAIYNDLTAKIRARQAKAVAEQPPPPPPPPAPDLPPAPSV